MIEDYTQKNPINIVEGADNMLLLNNPASMSPLSGDGKPQIRF